MDQGQQPRRPAMIVPWEGEMQRADRIIVGGILFAGIYSLALIPLFPLLGASHPALLELVRASVASIVNMGARAQVGETTLAAAILLGVPTTMMFDWLFWWAGRRWGTRVYAWLLGGADTPRARRRLDRVRRIERRVGPLGVVLANVLPVPSPLIYAAVGEGGMRLRTFLVLDLLGTLVWTGGLALLGYALGRDAVDVVDAISKYGLWLTIALVVVVVGISVRRAAATGTA